MLEGGQVGCEGPASMAKHGGSKQGACSGIQHVMKELAEKVVCWVDPGGSSCI